ncbi:MAG: sensor histidine kinase [Bacillota bacterium]
MMDKEYRLVTLIKMLTHIFTTVFILTTAVNKQGMNLLIIAVSFLFINSYLRNYLYSKAEYSVYTKASIVIELIIIAFISLIDNSGTSVLYFFVCLSEAIIAFGAYLGMIAASSIFLFAFIVEGVETNFENPLYLLVRILGNIGISLGFTFVMSYMVTLQLTEKRKLARMNTELEGAYKKLLENEAKIQQLIIEKERTRMAREIHDTLAHTLTTVVVQIEAARKLIAIDIAEAEKELIKAQEQTRNGLNDVRRSVKALKPLALENNSFFDALNSLISEIEKSADIKIEFIGKPGLDAAENPNRQLLEDYLKAVDVSLYRIIQESITNSIRHGHSTIIRLMLTLENSNIELKITDNGAGCQYIRKGYGLQGITERVEALSGKVSFSSLKNKGFITEVSIPVKPIQPMEVL